MNASSLARELDVPYHDVLTIMDCVMIPQVGRGRQYALTPRQTMEVMILILTDRTRIIAHRSSIQNRDP